MAGNRNKTDVKAQAKAMLDAWQRAVTEQLTDPSVLHQWLSVMQPPQPKDADATPVRKHARKPTVSPDARDDAIAALRKQLRQLEQRILALESAVDASAKAKKPHGKLAGSATKNSRNTRTPSRTVSVSRSARKKVTPRTTR